jgi:hypothetical protein
MSGLTARPAVADETKALTAICNQGIEDRVAPFATRLSDATEVAGASISRRSRLSLCNRTERKPSWLIKTGPPSVRRRSR